MKRILISCCITVIVFVAVSFSIAQVPRLVSDPAPVPVTCADFFTQPDAQIRFDSNPTQFHSLDADNDGRACEELPPVPEPVIIVIPIPDSVSPQGGVDTGDGTMAPR